MKFLKCNPESFGKLQNKEYTFTDGINVVTGHNEAGKSTLYRFLQGMLFGIEHSRGRGAKDSAYVRFKPWDTPGAYQGILDVELGGRKYRIERDFLQTEGGLRVTDIETGRDIPMRSEFFETVAPQITESGYVNTVMQPQSGAATEKELAALLQNTITNMSMAKNRSVDVSGAIDKLGSRIKEIEKKRIDEQIANLEQSIEDDELTQNELESMSNSYVTGKEKLAEVEERIARLEQDDAPEIEQEFTKQKERYGHYLDDVMEEEKRVADLALKHEKLKEYEAGIVSEESIIQALDEWEACDERLDNAKAQWDADKRVATEKRDEAAAEKKYAVVFIAFIMATVAIGVFLGFKKSIWCIFPLVFAVGAAVWFVIRRRILLRRLQAAEKMLRNVCDIEPDGYTKAKAAMEAMPSEEELREKARRNIETITRADQMRELIAEREEELEHFRAELTDEKSQLFYFYHQYVPEMEDLSEGEIQRITGAVMARSVELRENLKIARAERDELTRQVARLEQALEKTDMIEERLQDNRKLLLELKQERAENTKEIEALNVAMATIHSIAQDIHDSYGKKLNARMSEISEKLTDGHYSHIVVDENLKVKAGHKNHLVELEKLSSGTIEQIYLAQRLSVGETMYDEKLPLVFDDSFVYYDGERLRATLALLAELDRQVIICTCSDREEALLKEMHIAYNPIAM